MNIITTRLRNRLLLFFLVATIAGLAGCIKSPMGGFDEGEIHYSITYNEPGGVLPMELMPNSLVVKFKDDNILMEITAPIGHSGIYNIIKPDENIMQTFISFLGIKYYYQGESGEIPPGIDPMENLKFMRTGQTKTISGLNCKHAIVEIPGYNRDFNIWYTNDIDLDNPNISTPFKDIDGVLTNFFYKIGDMIIEFEITSVYQREVADKDFVKSDKFLRISREDMDNLISKMMTL